MTPSFIADAQFDNRFNQMHLGPGHPYYIYAPDFRDSSAGVVWLHYLCHLLNIHGRDAYVMGCNNVSPNLKTPLLSHELVDKHRQLGRIPIVIYPEVVSGNPAGADVVVRYLLNFEGALTGRGMEACSDDLRFYAAPILVRDTGERVDGFLAVPSIDTSVFNTNGCGIRKGRLLYRHRYPLDQMDLSLFPSDVHELAMHEPLPLARLAQLLKSAEVLYTYEWSITCVLAVLCGCPVIFMREGGIDETFLEQSYNGPGGFAMFDTPNALEIAHASLPDALANYKGLEKRFWAQLDHFIELTQARSEQHVGADRVSQQYQQWLGERALQGTRLRLYEQALVVGERPLHFEVVVFGGAGEDERTLASLARQHYPITQASFLPQATDYLKPWQALAQASSCQWFVLLPNGDEVTADLLLLAAEAISLNPRLQALYVDQDELTAQGPANPVFKPDFNLDLLRSYNYTGSLLLVSRDALLATVPSVADAGEAIFTDILLQSVERDGMTVVGHLSAILHHSRHGFAAWLAEQANPAAGRCIVQAHLQRLGLVAKVESCRLPFVNRVRLVWPGAPQVSLLVDARGPVSFVTRCLEGLLQTRGVNYQIHLVEALQVEPDLRAWLAEIEAMGEPLISVVRAPLSEAIESAIGEYLVVLDPGCLVTDPDWLLELLVQGRRQEVAAVGAKLMGHDDRVVSAGVVLGLRGAADCLFEGESDQSGGYLYRLQVVQNLSALDRRCLLLKKAALAEVGGMADLIWEQRGTDVELSLKLAQAGYLLVWTPYARLLWQDQEHDGAMLDEMSPGLYERWLPKLVDDAAYNRNFTREGLDFELETQPQHLWRPLAWRPLPVVQIVPGQSAGCAYYRVLQPFRALEQALEIEGIITERPKSPVLLAGIAADVVVVQREHQPLQMDALQTLRRATDAFVIYDMDDWLADSPAAGKGTVTGAPAIADLERALANVDRVVVSTPALANRLEGRHHDIRVVPTRLPATHWGSLVSNRRRQGRPRIGFAGNAGHRLDLAIIEEVIQALGQEVEWVFLGIRPAGAKIDEFHAPVPIEDYPRKLAGLDLDIALAPLLANDFNECKSNLRLLEMGACGYPVIASDIAPYQGGLPVQRVANEPEKWLEAIRAHLVDLDAAFIQGQRLREAVQRDWLLEGANLRSWKRDWLPG